MKSNQPSLISFLLLAAVSSHCGSSSDGKKEAPAVKPSLPVVSPEPVVQAADLQGVWVGRCHEVQDEESGETTFARDAYVIKGDSVQLVSSEYAADDKDCQKSQTLLTLTMKARFSGGSPTFQADLVTESLRFQINDADKVTAFNLGEAFGYNDWQQGVAKDITKAPGVEFEGDQYTIVKVEKNQLLWGEATDARDGSSPDKRPNVFESDAYERADVLPFDAEPKPTIPASAAEFQGTWVGTCDAVGGFFSNKKTYSQWRYVIQGTDVLWFNMSFGENDKDCTLPLNVITYVMTGVFGKASESVAGAREVDLVFNRLEYRIDDDQGVLEANARKEYGFSDWQKSVTKDISKAPGISNWPVVYTLLKVDEAGLHLASITSDRNGSTAEKRPIQVSATALKRLP